MSSEDFSSIKIIAIGLNSDTVSFIESVVDSAIVRYVDNRDDYENVLDRNADYPESITILAGSTVSDLHPEEIGQSLRGHFIKARIVFLATDITQFHFKILKKNGFDDIFLLPLDQCFLQDEIIKSVDSRYFKKKYTPVSLFDIQAEKELDFNLYTYMPATGKYILLNASKIVTYKKIKNLQKWNQHIVYIEIAQEALFENYIQECKKNFNNMLSTTENEISFRLQLKDIFHSVLDQHTETNFDFGREVQKKSLQAVQGYVASRTDDDVKSTISCILSGHFDFYSRTLILASLLYILGRVLDIAKDEDLAIAGLFHDISLFSYKVIPNEFDMPNMSEAELAKYKKHPVDSLDLLRNKKFMLSSEVIEIIENHHERINGTGFPFQLVEHKISMPTQLLIFCDLLECFMHHEEGVYRVTSLEATEKIEKMGAVSKELILKIKNILT